MGQGCPRCSRAVALHEGRPVVAASGVQLWHASCFERRAEPMASATDALLAPVPARPVRDRRVIHMVAASVALLTATGASIAIGVRSDSSALASSMVNIDPGDRESLAITSSIATHERVPPDPNALSVTDKHPIPALDEKPLDETYPSLKAWVHPVTSTAELLPERHSRLFGSERAGIERAECGDGHCGVDLDGPRGRPLVAVADGVLIRVERRELGADGRSGRYVRIQHDDGSITAYMHMDDVGVGLEVGNRVTGGQYVGTLGATAVYSAAPHLHFSLEIPDHAGDRGDTVRTHYVDPAPFLVRATIVEKPERKHSIKPAI